MDCSQNSCPSGLPPFRKPGGARRVWTKPEEVVLIDALKDLVSNGWRAGNDFRPGYLAALERAMGQKFPHGRPMTEKNINSKLTVWKKTLASLDTLVNTSGFGFVTTNQMVDVPSDQVWNEYVKTHPDVESFRYKSFPYYEDWLVIFGTNRANGKAAQGITDAILDLENPHQIYDEVLDEHVRSGAKRKTKSSGTFDFNKRPRDAEHEDPIDANEFSSSNYNEDMGNKKTTADSEGASERKRKSREPTLLPDQLVSFIGGLFQKGNETLGEMADKGIAGSVPPPPPPATPPPPSPASKSKQVFDVIAEMGLMPLQLRILVAHKIVNNPQSTDLFLGMDELCREEYISMIVSGALDPSAKNP